MLTFKHLVVASVLVALVSLGPRPTLAQVPEERREARIEWSELPPNVQKTVKALAAKGKVGTITVEEEEEGLIYEVEVILPGGRVRTLSVDPDGTLIEIEEEVEWRSLPPAVRAGLERLAKGGTIVEVEMVTRGKTVSYEADVRHGDDVVEIAVDQRGNRIAAERSADEWLEKAKPRHEAPRGEEDEDEDEMDDDEIELEGEAAWRALPPMIRRHLEQLAQGRKIQEIRFVIKFADDDDADPRRHPVKLESADDDSEERYLEESELPPAVQRLVARLRQSGEVRGVSREDEDGQVRYEIEGRANDRGRSVIVTAEGQVLAIEEEVEWESLPMKVRSGLERLANGGEITEVCIVRSNLGGKSRIHYEADVRKGEREWEIQVDGAGNPLVARNIPVRR